jgi:hypothetical protein
MTLDNQLTHINHKLTEKFLCTLMWFVVVTRAPVSRECPTKISKNPVKNPQFSAMPKPPRGYPPFCQMGLLLYPTITNTLEWIGFWLGVVKDKHIDLQEDNGEKYANHKNLPTSCVTHESVTIKILLPRASPYMTGWDIHLWLGNW